jgi:sigma-B regulation protein RsbU (phosphoserine phosphatase)
LLHRSGQKPVLLDSTCPLISSVFADSSCPTEQQPLEPGDLLLFYTDGVTEAHGPGGLFGAGRLAEVVTQSKSRGSLLLDRILEATLDFSAGRPVEDDITLVLAEFGSAT